ncbi:molybdopterin-dependent oxidoreductase [Paralimibaculum aggregatum]|uniref:Molybdopterin-dependent oxidoreductase n=1 Tax=Paralimibaculum aggregatum TaxID=3036245 RepID=A0ABQ6LTW3_9RHOB|nr:molybdopterin cofactor-binding domain-containing protein [Limibaculum sp. NKW23]GMG85511.1 molybdopterin-dependent oxidoreductase [Limibaculum sp. NKW23]
MTKTADNRNPDALSSLIDLSGDGVVRVLTGKVEIGQGLHHALRVIAAEELGISLDAVRIAAPNTTTSRNEGITSGSNSISQAGTTLMRACSQLREIHRAWFAEAAGCEPDAITVEDGHFLAGGRPLGSYWSARGDVDLDVDMVDLHSPWPGTGRFSAKKADSSDKFTGRKSYLPDMVLPGMRHATVVRHPAQHNRLVLPEDLSEMMAPGLIEIVQRHNFLAVIAETEDLAHAFARRLAERVDRDFETDLRILNDIETLYPKSEAERSTVLAKGVGTRGNGRQVSARYTKPFIAHASIGLSCALAWLKEDRLRVWSHSQGIFHLRREIATIVGMDESAIEVQHVEMAGCYGHNGADDAALDAAVLATMRPGLPIRVQWTREDELTNGPLGAAMLIDLEATVDDDNRITWWSHEIWSNGHVARPGRTPEPTLRAGPELSPDHRPYVSINTPVRTGGAAERNSVPIYDFPSVKVSSNRILANPVRTSSLRSLGAFGNVFAIERFMDEISVEAGICPAEFRLRNLSDDRARAVLEDVLERSDYRAARRSGRAVGCGVARYKNLGAYCACVAEVEIDFEVSVKRLHIGVDMGRVIDRDGALNQIEGGAVQATSWALKEQVIFGPETIENNDWESYPILKFSEVPEIEVHIFDSDAAPSGAGEAAQGPVAAALGNAASIALGVPIRSLPITRDRILSALEAT